MNEIVAPIYYVFSNDADPLFKGPPLVFCSSLSLSLLLCVYCIHDIRTDGYEADVFHCFTVVMGEVMNNFIKTLDGADVGITGLIARLNLLLKERDHELWHNLVCLLSFSLFLSLCPSESRAQEDKKLHPQFYSFRWLTLLLSQEFQLPGTSLFSFLSYHSPSLSLHQSPTAAQTCCGCGIRCSRTRGASSS